MKNKKIAFFAIAIALVVLVAGCTTPSGTEDTGETTTTKNQAPAENTDITMESEGGPTEVTSIDVSVSGYAAGEMEAGYRIRARELDQDNPDLRVDAEESDQVIIYNNDEGVGYVYQPDKDMWLEVSGTMADTFVDAFIDTAFHIKDVVDDYGVGETATLTVGSKSGKWTKNAENPSFDDSIFKPPAGANIQGTDIPVG